MSDYIIGRVISVNGGNIDIVLDDFNNASGVPDNMNININTDEGPKPLQIGQPGSFLKIDISGGSLLCMVSEIKMKEGSISNSKESDSVYEIVTPVRTLTLVPFGSINSKGKFERGTDVLPTINSKVYAVSGKTIKQIYQSYSDGDFNLGKLSLMPEQEALINLDSFLSRHGAILGQTGSGKSWTVASFLQKIMK